MEETSRVSARERRRRDTAARIQAAALRLFHDQGFAETTVDEIAAEAGASRATIFRYFGSKDDIVFSVDGPLLEAMRTLLQRRPHAPLGEVVMAFAEQVDATVPDLRLRGVIIAATPRLVERFAVVRTRWEADVAAELAARRGPRATPRIEEQVMAAVVIGALFVAFRRWAAEPGTRLARHARAAVAAAPLALPPAASAERGARRTGKD